MRDDDVASLGFLALIVGILAASAWLIYVAAR